MHAPHLPCVTTLWLNNFPPTHQRVGEVGGGMCYHKDVCMDATSCTLSCIIFFLSRGFFFHISSLIHVNEFILTCSIIHTGSMLSSQRLNKVMAEVSWQIFIWVLLIKSNPSCILPCDWSRQFVPSFQPIRCKSKTKLSQLLFLHLSSLLIFLLNSH